MKEIIPAVLVMVLSVSIVFAAEWQSTYWRKIRQKKALLKEIKKQGMKSISEYTEKLIETQKKEWKLQNGQLCYYPNSQNKKLYFVYQADYQKKERKLHLYREGELFFEMILAEKDGNISFVISNDADGSFDEVLGRLKYERLFDHLDVFYRRRFRRDIDIEKERAEAEKNRLAFERNQAKQEFLAFMEQTTLDNVLQGFSEKNVFHVRLHHDAMGCYATLYCGENLVCQAMLREERITFDVVTEEEWLQELINENEEQWKTIFKEFLEQYHKDVLEIVDRIQNKCLYLSNQQHQWLLDEEKNMIRHIRSLAEEVKSGKLKRVSSQQQLVDILKERLALLHSFDEYIEQRKILRLTLQKERIKRYDF